MTASIRLLKRVSKKLSEEKKLCIINRCKNTEPKNYKNHFPSTGIFNFLRSHNKNGSEILRSGFQYIIVGFR